MNDSVAIIFGCVMLCVGAFVVGVAVIADRLAEIARELRHMNHQAEYDRDERRALRTTAEDMYSNKSAYWYRGGFRPERDDPDYST